MKEGKNDRFERYTKRTKVDFVFALEVEERGSINTEFDTLASYFEILVNLLL